MLNWVRDTTTTNCPQRWAFPSVLIRAIRVSYPGSSLLIDGLILALCILAFTARAEDPSDPVLNLLLQKGIVTQAEVDKAKAEAQRIRTNEFANLMPPIESKWKISKGIQNIELFGDLRLRYEHREATVPGNERL